MKDEEVCLQNSTLRRPVNCVVIEKLRRYQQQQNSVLECSDGFRLAKTKPRQRCRKSCSVSPDNATNVERSRHRTSSVCSLPAGPTGFHHDELRSPFTYVGSSAQRGTGGSCSAAPLATSGDGTAARKMINGPTITKAVLESTDARHLPSDSAVGHLLVNMDGLPPAWPSDAQTNTTQSPVNECRDCAALKTENKRLSNAFTEKNLLSQQVIGQYNKLQEQYTKLYEAYNSLNERVPKSGTQPNAERSGRNDLADEVQKHIKVINVLVDEKSELQSQLRQTMEIANTHYARNQSLQQQLNAEQERSSALEAELQQLKRKDANLESMLQKQLIELNNCYAESAQIRKRTAELEQERSELGAKLKVRTRELNDLNQKLKEVESSYQASQIYVQQMKGLTIATDKEEAKYLTELKDKNTEIENLKNSVAYLKRELTSSQTLHTSFTREWNEKILKLNEKIQQLSGEKSTQQLNVSQLTADLEAARDEVRRLKEKLSNDSTKAVTPEPQPDPQLQILNQRLQEVESHLNESNQMRDSMEKELERLQSEVDAKTDQIAVLSRELNEQTMLRNNTKELLEQLRNEKATSSRAVGQNVELKQQLLELQTKLIQMTDSMADLTTRLASAESLVSRLQSSNVEGEKKDDGQTSDDEDGRHKMISPDVLVLEHELSECKDRIQQLSAENSELHSIMEHNAEDENQNTIYVELQQALHRITALSQENESLKSRLTNVNDKVMQRDNGSEDGAHENDTPGASSMSNDSSETSEDKEELLMRLKRSMEQLQQRFVRAMSENADLAEQNQQLEHLIVQLQSETDTIGEYVTLYRYQRKVVKERLHEHEDYIARLAREKEIMQEKVAQLQQLVVHLMHESSIIVPYTKTLPTYSKPKPLPPSKPPLAVSAVVETLVDETIRKVESGDRPVTRLHSLSESAASSLNSDALTAEKSDVETKGRSAIGSENVRSDNDKPSPTVYRILRLLDEIQNPSPSNEFHISDIHLHCKHCKGTLLTL